MSDKKSPEVGDMFRCDKCNMEIHVTKGCECADGCAEFKCCGQTMENVTEPPVLNP